MDRPLIYAQEQGRSTDFLFGQRAAMIGLAKVAEAILGTATFMSGLGCVPTSPASMSVQVNPGQIFSLQNVDSSPYGILGADTTHQILKQGLMLDATQLACPAPTTSGYSINYLVQVAFQETDTTNVVLPFYDSSNPSQPYSGQNNNGTALPTERQDQCVVSVKAGAAAATGSQTTPSPDAGYIGAYVVTVAYGAATITSTNISTYPNAPFLPSDGVFRGLQLGETQYAVDTGAANALAFSLNPAPTALVDGQVFRVKAANSNTGPTTINPNGLGPTQAYSKGSAMVGGEIVAGGFYTFQYDASASVAHLIAASKGLSGGEVVGATVNLRMSVTAASSTATITADEITVVSALGKPSSKIGTFNKSINLATVGAGGMDTGTAPVSGYVAIYAIYNPTTGASALLGVDATSAVAPEVYGGASMPAGYAASALVSVWPTNASGQFIIADQFQRSVSFLRTGVYSTTSPNATFTPVSVSGSVPKNAKSMQGDIQNNNGSTTQSATVAIAGSLSGIGALYGTALYNAQIPYRVPLTNPQTVYIINTSVSGTNNVALSISSYDF